MRASIFKNCHQLPALLAHPHAHVALWPRRTSSIRYFLEPCIWRSVLSETTRLRTSYVLAGALVRILLIPLSFGLILAFDLPFLLKSLDRGQHQNESFSANCN